MSRDSRPEGMPEWVLRTLESGEAVDVDSVRLRPPTRLGARGGPGRYRWEWRDPLTGDRRQRGSKDLAKAWAAVLSQVEDNDRLTQGLGGRVRADVPLGTVIERYLDPAGHARWGEDRADRLRSLFSNWVTGERIAVPVGGAEVLARDIPIGELTPNRAEMLLNHVREARSPRTYKDVHVELRTMLRWAVREGYLPAGSRIFDHIGLAKPDGTGGGPRDDGQIDPEDIPPPDAIEALRRAAHADEPGWGRLAVDVLTYGGTRVGELLGLLAGDMIYMEEHGCYRPYVRHRTHAWKAEVRPPKHHKKRHLWLPPWMTEDIDRRLQILGDHPRVFPAPRGGWWPVRRFTSRRFDRWMEKAGWPKLPEDDTRMRVWRWTAHSLRHHAASWMLNELKLGADDVAQFLGHRDGHQISVIYGHSMPGLTGRASAAATDAGDPRDGTRSPQ